MNAPFGGPQAFGDKDTTQTLTLNFRGEATRLDLQDLRANLTRIEARVGSLIEMLEPTAQLQDPLSRDRDNGFIRAAFAKDAFGLDRKYPDMIKLKVYPKDVTFVDTNGKLLKPEDIDFHDYDLQPTVQLRDIWKMGTTFYPRLVMTHCVLHPRTPQTLIGHPTLNLKDLQATLSQP